MQVTDEVLNCTAFLGTKTRRGFAAAGTAFFICYEQDDFVFVYLVTTAHLMWPGRSRHEKGPPAGYLDLRVNSQTGVPSIEKIEHSEWLYAERGIDLAIRPEMASIASVSEFPMEGDVGVLNMNGGIALRSTDAGKKGLTIGDEIFVVGAFVPHVGESKNIPIVRTGNIAAMPHEPIPFSSPRVPPYLVETRSIGGLSGSPVFLNLQTQRLPTGKPKALQSAVTNQKNITRKAQLLPHMIIGIMLGAHEGLYEQDFVNDGKRRKASIKDAQFNSGISVVLPVDALFTLLESEPVKEKRDKDIEAARKASGFRPTSASSSNESNQKGGTLNPYHKEDFTSLLSAAARAKPKGA